nr:uncharacterized protein LOC129383373 [Dermacentor andersoni]
MFGRFYAILGFLLNDLCEDVRDRVMYDWCRSYWNPAARGASTNGPIWPMCFGNANAMRKKDKEEGGRQQQDPLKRGASLRDGKPPSSARTRSGPSSGPGPLPRISEDFPQAMDPWQPCPGHQHQ